MVVVLRTKLLIRRDSFPFHAGNIGTGWNKWFPKFPKEVFFFHFWNVRHSTEDSGIAAESDGREFPGIFSIKQLRLSVGCKIATQTILKTAADAKICFACRLKITGARVFVCKEKENEDRQRLVLSSIPSLMWRIFPASKVEH